MKPLQSKLKNLPLLVWMTMPDDCNRLKGSMQTGPKDNWSSVKNAL